MTTPTTCDADFVFIDSDGDGNGDCVAIVYPPHIPFIPLNLGCKYNCEPATTSVVGQLPATGTTSAPVVGTASGVLLVGIALSAIARRARRRTA